MTPLRVVLRGLVLALLAAVIASCSDQVTDPLAVPTELMPASVADGQTATAAAVSITGGDGQQGTVGSNLPNRLTVRVTDAESLAIPGVSVTWTVLTGGGSISRRPNRKGNTLPLDAPTDDYGISAVYWRLGTIAGQQTARAAVGSVAAGFTATARAAAPARLVKLGGDAQSATVATRLADSLSVQVVDGFGNAVSGTTVNWSVVAGGGSVSPAATTTNARGVVRTSWTMGAVAGPDTAKASIPRVDEETFSATATPGNPAPSQPPPGPPGPPVIATADINADTFMVTARWGRGTNAVTYDWSTGASNGAWNQSGQVTDSSVVIRAPRTPPNVDYWFCVYSVNSAGIRSADKACGVYVSPASGSGTLPTVTAINVVPGSAMLAPGQTQQFTASATLSNGGIQSNANVTWTSTGGSVNTSGLYTAGSTAGTFRVIATGSGFADTANVSINAPPPPPGTDNKYFNSAEVGCSTDSNVLLCDDFEDGDWYPIHCDASGNAGRTDPAARADGWCGSIYANPITPAGAADCSGAIGAFGRCAATSGSLSGSVGGRNMAEHALANDQEVQEVYIRWYYRPSPGFSWGPQKVMSVNRCCNGGGIYWAGLGYNIGRGVSSTSPPVIGITNNRLDADPAAPGTTSIWGLNVSGYSPTGGRWSYYEMHIKLNTPGQANGVWEFWANDCGTSAAGCTGTPTLRARHTNVNWGKTTSNGGIGSLWWENWANPGAIGTEWYDQIKVSKVPVGFAR